MVKSMNQNILLLFYKSRLRIWKFLFEIYYFLKPYDLYYQQSLSYIQSLVSHLLMCWFAWWRHQLLIQTFGKWKSFYLKQFFAIFLNLSYMHVWLLVSQNSQDQYLNTTPFTFTMNSEWIKTLKVKLTFTKQIAEYEMFIIF